MRLSRMANFDAYKQHAIDLGGFHSLLISAILDFCYEITKQVNV